MAQTDYPIEFSIVTPVYNAVDTLEETVASIRGQSFEGWELWLIDDGSTDGSDRLIEQLVRTDPRIKTIHLPKQSGAATARNRGIEAAQGRYIAFLDADDLWDAPKLEMQHQVLETGAGFVFSSYRRVDEDGRDLGMVRAPAQLDYQHALQGNCIGCLTAVYDTQVYGKVLMPQLVRRQDYGLWLRLLRDGSLAVGLAPCLATYRVRRSSLSSNKLLAAKATWNVYRYGENLGLVASSRCFAYYAMGALATRAMSRWRSLS